MRKLLAALPLLCGIYLAHAQESANFPNRLTSTSRAPDVPVNESLRKNSWSRNGHPAPLLSKMALPP